MPRYNLEEVRNAARLGNVEYRGLKVSRDIANLGYEFDHVCQCLLQLTTADFHKTHRYENGSEDDAYCLRSLNPVSEEQEFDDLYIKFRLIGCHVSISLGSFHLQQ